MNVYAPAVYPVPDRFINVGKEPSPGTIAAGTYTYPMTTFKPVDKITPLPDSAWRNGMAELYNLIQGVRIADVSCGGPLFADGIGYVAGRHPRRLLAVGERHPRLPHVAQRPDSGRRRDDHRRLGGGDHHQQDHLDRRDRDDR